MALTGDLIVSAVLTAALGSASTAAEIALVKDVTVRKTSAPYLFNDNATAATTQIESLVFENTTGVDLKLVKATITTVAAVTASDAAAKQWTVQKRLAAGGAAVPMIAPSTQTTAQANGIGTTVAFAPVTVGAAVFAVTPQNLTLAPGDSVGVLMGVIGAGVVTTGATGTVGGKVVLVFEPVL